MAGPTLLEETPITQDEWRKLKPKDCLLAADGGLWEVVDNPGYQDETGPDGHPPDHAIAFKDPYSEQVSLIMSYKFGNRRKITIRNPERVFLQEFMYSVCRVISADES